MDAFILVGAVLLAVVSMGMMGYLGSQIFRKGYARYEERYLEAVGKKLEGMFVTIPPAQVLYLRFMSAFVMLMVGGLICSPAPLLAKPLIVGVFTIIGYIVPQWMLRRMEVKRVEKFNDQLVDGLSTVSNCLKSGFSFPQALEMLVNEGQPPLSQEFGLVLREYRMGRSLDEALHHLLQRVPSDDADIAVTSILVTREIGGNLAVIFDQIANTIRERNRLQGKIRALTSQGKLQGIVVGILPIALGVAVHFINPELMKPMYTTILGWGFILIIVVLEVIGGFLIKKIVTIDI